MWRLTDSPFSAPDKPEDLTIFFEKGIPVKVSTASGDVTGSLELFVALNKLGRIHSIGRIDM